jgi:hypothetical protein
MAPAIQAHGDPATSGIAGGGLVLLVVGVLAVAAGLGLLAFTPEDAATSDVGRDDGASSDGTARQGRLGQTIAVGGGAVAFLGLIFIVIGRAD